MVKTGRYRLQEKFDVTVRQQVVNAVLLKAIRQAFSQHGIQLSKSQQANLARTIRAGRQQKLNIPLTKRQQKFLGEKKVDLASVDNATLDKLYSETWGQLQPKIPSSLLEIADSVSILFIRDIKKRTKVTLRARRNDQSRFERRLWRRWRQALELLQAFVFIAIEAGETAASRLDATRPLTSEVLVRLHARACQVAYEIVALLVAGFADGAHARWRTLHELAVTAFFIAEHGEPLAERYLLHQGIETFKAAEQFQRYCKRLGYKPLTKRQYFEIESRKEHLVQRFGKAFRGDYGWADLVIQNGGPTFRHIEEKVRLDYIRPYYKLACQNVHAGAKGLFERLGLYDNECSVLLAGPSSIGLADPGHAAAISLSQITTCLLLMQPALDSFVLVRVLDRLQKEIGHTFLKLQNAGKEGTGASKGHRA